MGDVTPGTPAQRRAARRPARAQTRGLDCTGEWTDDGAPAPDAPGRTTGGVMRIVGTRVRRVSNRMALWLAALLLALAGTLGPAALPARAQPDVGPLSTAVRDGVTVRVGLPSEAQLTAIFGVPVLRKGIQPVWVEIANATGEALWYLPITTDPTYYSPAEASFRFREALRPAEDAARDALFEAQRMPLFVDAGQTVSGFVFTHREDGLKFLSVGLLKGQNRLSFAFIVPVPGSADATRLMRIPDLVPAGQAQDVDLQALRERLSALPCCTSNAEGTRFGDPLNLVVVGDGLETLFPFVQRGWRLAQRLGIDSGAQMAVDFVLGREDDTAPVSPLYLFGRHQDIAIQKARNTISERNHLRLWLTPLRFEGRSVWAGQISRDIGVELTTKSWYGTTHKIDPQVDFDREYLLQDLLLSSAIARFGYVRGVGPSGPPSPRTNLTGDPYVTDGLRLVVMLRQAQVPGADVVPLPWERPR